MPISSGPLVNGPVLFVDPRLVTESESLDSTSPDTTPLGEDGPLAPKKSCLMMVIVLSLATPSIVKGSEHDKAAGPDSGVDDHAIKFAGTTESSVWTNVTSCCVEKIKLLTV